MARTANESPSPLIYIGSKAGILNEITLSFTTGDVMDRTWLVPFCGGLAAIFHFRPERAILTDFCPELIHFWEMLRDDWEAVSSRARKCLAGAVGADGIKNAYYQARDDINSKIKKGTWGAERAGLFLFLNRFGYRGRWRVNRRGLCNIPFDHNRVSSGKIPDTGKLQACSKYLQRPGIEIHHEDWAVSLQRAKSDSLVICDPPYHKVYDYSDRVADAQEFGDTGQLRLAHELLKLHGQGIPFMLHNNPTALVRRIYTNKHYQWMTITRDHKVGYGRTLAPGATEIIVTNQV